jgi:hypothetical protein
MIPINDMFRLGSSKQSRWNVTLWHLEEWTPADRIEGRWQRCSDRLRYDDMDCLLEQMMCPREAHAAFRATETGVLDELPIGGVRSPPNSVRKNTPLRAAT